MISFPESCFRPVLARVLFLSATSLASAPLVHAQAPLFISASSANFTVGQAGSFTVVVMGTPTPTLSLTGTFPGWAAFNFSTGVISGTPYDASGSPYICTLTATNSAGTASQIFTLTVTQPPQITSLNTASFVEGQSGVFAVQATGSPTPSFTITFGSFPSGLSLNPLTGVISGIPAAGASAASPYLVQIMASNGVSPAAVQNLTITVTSAALPPAFTTQPASVTVAPGQTVSFTAVATGNPTPTIQWQRLAVNSGVFVDLVNDATFSGVTSATLMITNPTSGMSGDSYRAIATNSGGTTASLAATLSLVIGPTIFTAPASVTIVANDRTQLRVSAIGTGTLSYQWYQGTSGDTSTPFLGATSATFTTPTLTATTSYWVRITDGNGNITNSPAATVTVSATSPLVVSQSVMGLGYTVSGAVSVTNTITYTGTAPSRIDWATLLPTGWKYVASGGSEGAARPQFNAPNLLEWTWTTVPASPITFVYTVSVPIGTNAEQIIASLVTSQQAGTNYQAMAKPDPLVVRSASLHNADSNRDGRISLLELTRVIELYNYRAGTIRTGQYKAKSGTEDGFEPGP